MRIPKQVKVSCHVYSVNLRPVPEDLQPQNMGVTVHEKHAIYIDSTADKTAQEETFLHELLHVIFYSQGMNNSPVKEYEEYVVDTLSKGLYPLIDEMK